jgi:esterase/lipase
VRSNLLKKNFIFQALDWAKAIIIIGSTSFIFYRFVRSWILPKFFGLKNPENERIKNIEKQIVSITETNKAIVESVKQTIGTICEQNEQINRSLLIIQSQTRNNYLNDDKGFFLISFKNYGTC